MYVVKCTEKKEIAGLIPKTHLHITIRYVSCPLKTPTHNASYSYNKSYTSIPSFVAKFCDLLYRRSPYLYQIVLRHDKSQCHC